MNLESLKMGGKENLTNSGPTAARLQQGNLFQVALVVLPAEARGNPRDALVDRDRRGILLLRVQERVGPAALETRCELGALLANSVVSKPIAATKKLIFLVPFLIYKMHIILQRFKLKCEPKTYVLPY